MFGGDADDVDLVDPALPQPLGQGRSVRVDALEAAVCRAPGTLAEDGLDPARVEVGPDFGAGGPCDAVRGPRGQ